MEEPKGVIKDSVMDAITGITAIVTADVVCSYCGEMHRDCTFHAVASEHTEYKYGALRRMFRVETPLPCNHRGFIWLAARSAWN